MKQKVDANDSLNTINFYLANYYFSTIDYYSITIPRPVKKLYKLMKNIVLVHLDDFWNEQKVQELIKQLYQNFDKLKKNKIGYVQFRITATRLKFVDDYLGSIKFNQSYD